MHKRLVRKPSTYVHFWPNLGSRIDSKLGRLQLPPIDRLRASSHSTEKIFTDLFGVLLALSTQCPPRSVNEAPASNSGIVDDAEALSNLIDDQKFVVVRTDRPLFVNTSERSLCLPVTSKMCGIYMGHRSQQVLLIVISDVVQVDPLDVTVLTITEQRRNDYTAQGDSSTALSTCAGRVLDDRSANQVRERHDEFAMGDADLMDNESEYVSCMLPPYSSFEYVEKIKVRLLA